MNSRHDVESALNEVAGLIDEATAGASDNVWRAEALLDKAAAAAPRLPLPAEDPLHARIAALGQALDALQRARENEHGPAGAQGQGGHVLFPG